MRYQRIGFIATLKYRNSHQRCSMKKSILRNFAKFTGKHLCQILVTWQKGTLVFSYEVCKISNNTFFTEHIWATASSCTKEIVDQDYFCFYEKSVLLIFKEHRPKKLVEATMCSTATRNCESVLKHALRRCYLPV